MAFAQRETIIANPGRRRIRNRGPMTAKQIKYFGTKRQKAALKATRKRKLTNARRRHSVGKAKANRHRARTKPNRRHHKATARTQHRTRTKPKVNRKSRRTNKSRRRHNPGEIIALAANPARKKGKTKMAATKGKRHHTSKAGKRHNPGHHKKLNARRHHRRHNPGKGVTRVVRATVFAAGGFIVSKVGTQAVMGANNTGWMGYLGNAVATAILAFGAHAVTSNPEDAFMVAVGGGLNILGRIISDYSLLGSYSSQLGMGDYMVSNFVTPQRLSADFRSLTDASLQVPQGWGPGAAPPTAVISSSGVSTAGAGLSDGMRRHGDWL
jgi:hypothetical protein